MASGISSPQGWSPQMVAGMDNVPDQNDTFLWNQLSLTSTTNPFQGKKTTIAFGKKKLNLNKINKFIFYLKSL